MVAAALTSGTISATSWRRLGFQLGGGVLFAIALPVGLWILLVREAVLNGPAAQALIGSVVGLVLGCWLLRNFSQFPGLEASSHIVTSFSISFGVVVAYFFVMRLEYVRPIFVSAYLLSIVWSYVIYFLTQRQRLLRVGVVPFGAVDRLEYADGISWVPMSPDEVVNGRYDLIVADFAAELPERWERMVADCSLRGLPVYSVKHLMESVTGEVEIEHLSENQFGSLIPASAYMKIKVFLDWLAAMAVLPLLLPAMATIAVIIKLDSPGPALFAQRRVGFRGHHFTVFKFRTMTTSRLEVADVRNDAITQNNDHRITRVGRFLRKWRIDELPQIVNVLRGEMSWIGPRPEAVPLSEWYEAEIPFYRYRHIVRPGITGWAQVSQGHVADVASVQKKLNYDFYYIKYFSPWLDMLIGARTIRTMLTGFGSR